MKKKSLLICDDDNLIHLSLKQTLKSAYDLRSAYNPDEALAIIKNHPIDLLLLDVQMRTPDEGIQALPKLKEMDPELTIVMMTGVTDFKTVREAMRLGATDYVVKDLENNDLNLVLERALDRRHLLQRNEQQTYELTETQTKHIMIGKSPQIATLRKTIERIRNSPANVIILGETGTGKEVVARNLRKTLPDGSLAPFVAIDSATIQSSTAESLLFGHEKGAFTGAEKTTKGIFEEAHGGIVYFDEIANMTLDIQAKLLRVIQEKEVTRLGSSKVISLDFRVVCASNRDLDHLVKQGAFKEDLLQRLSVIPLTLPPLRERRDDIVLLLSHFLSKQPSPLSGFSFTEAATALLMQYPWPGNIRELANLVAYVAAMVDGPEIDLSDLPPKFRDAAFQTQLHAPPIANDTENFYDQVATFEKQLLIAALKTSDGNIRQLALRLGMDRSHLYSKLKEYDISVERVAKK